ncbi:MAG: aminopeptidase P family protein [Helicobacter sp.]|nr:aminopeptidase P family protein [Helicobacter sp.]
MEIYQKRLGLLRKNMRENHLDVCVILNSDPHLNEYLPEHYQAIKWLCGFDGSAGTLVVTHDYAGLWTDGRYFEQALRQLPSDVVLEKQSATQNYKRQLANFSGKIGIDFAILPFAAYKELCALLNPASLVDCDCVGNIWKERPKRVANAIYAHNLDISRTQKLRDVRAKMRQMGAEWHFVSSLDDIAWITNLRGSDILYNPVFSAFLLISANKAQLFLHRHSLSESLQKELRNDGFSLFPYKNAQKELAKLKKRRVLVDRITTRTARILQQNGNKLREELAPSTLQKACKSEAVVARIQDAMIRDGIALCRFFAWLEGALLGEILDECDIDTHLTAFRAEMEHYVGNSFATIAGFGANGALPHYQAKRGACAKLLGDNLLLLDSGAQYLDGTTDITRVVPVGNPSEAQKRDYTLVLQAHIAIAQARFPDKIAMPLLDSIARAPLWQHGLDYAHGTGHGVGYFLNVHEGPQSLSLNAPISLRTRVHAGMVTSIEPGIYREGQWGIRLENLVVAKASAHAGFLEFMPLTLCPFEPRLIVRTMLTEAQREWLDSYHARVWELLAPHLSGDVREWLEKRVEKF